MKLKTLLKTIWPSPSSTYTPSREQLERVADAAFQGADRPNEYVLAFAIRESGFKVKPEDVARARELDAASKAASALLNKHDRDAEHLAELEHTERAALAALAGEAIAPRDVPAEFASARAAARDAGERAGEAACELYCRLTDECLPLIEKFVDSHVVAERALHETLGLKYRPSGISLALHGAPAKLNDFATKLRAAPKRSVSVPSMFAVFEVFEPMPAAPPPPPKPVPYVAPPPARSVELTPEQSAENRRLAMAAKEARKAQLAAAGIIKLGGAK